MKDALGDIFKALERSHRSALPQRMPVIIRVDGRAFHTYTRTLSAHDEQLAGAMWRTAEALCREIMGARCAFSQSDEISVLVNPWSSPNSEAWFSNEIQKIVSISASIAAARVTAMSATIFGTVREAQFDARAFAVLPENVNSYFVWRQLDAHRNAVNAVAQHYFSAKQLHGASLASVRQMLRDKGVPFEAEPNWVQRGALTSRVCSSTAEGTVRHAWRTAEVTPWFAEDTTVIPALLGEVVPEGPVE